MAGFTKEKSEKSKEIFSANSAAKKRNSLSKRFVF